jgi:hypothetical protein
MPDIVIPRAAVPWDVLPHTDKINAVAEVYILAFSQTPALIHDLVMGGPEPFLDRVKRIALPLDLHLSREDYLEVYREIRFKVGLLVDAPHDDLPPGPSAREQREQKAERIRRITAEG